MTLRKIVLLKDATVSDEGRFEGYGAVYNNVDDGGDEILPGAMASAIPGFLKSGFISWSHEWSIPVAYPKGASEDAHGMYIDAQFHSTPTAQEKRTITKERLDAGLSMGLSIGYGEVVAKRLPDRKQISKIGYLPEVGLVMVPMNREAGVAGIKAAADNVSRAVYCLTTINDLIASESIDQASGDTTESGEIDALITARDALLAFVGDESAEVGTTADIADIIEEDAARMAMYGYMGRTAFPDHILTVQTSLKALVARSKAIARLRKEGRVLSAANRTRMESLIEALAAASSDIADLLASTDAPTKDRKATDLLLLLEQARFLGVAV